MMPPCARCGGCHFVAWTWQGGYLCARCDAADGLCGPCECPECFFDQRAAIESMEDGVNCLIYETSRTRH